MITTWSKGAADENMPEAILVETLQRVRRHPWWRARARLALTVLRRHGISPPASVLDVGCGWGVNLEALERRGYNVSGLDISRQILQRIDAPSRKLIEADLNRELPAATTPWDGLLVLDVIEHLDDDRGAIRRLAGLVRPGGIAVVSVPARPDLFSEFDRIQGHRRRYLPVPLREAFAGSGLDVSEIFWWGAWMVPVLRRMRGNHTEGGRPARTYADYLRLPLWPAPLLMKLIYACEQPLAMKGRLKTGTSLFVVACRS